MISYAPFYRTLKDRNISQYELIHMGVDVRLISYIKKNKNITVKSINKLCLLLNCTPNDILEIIPTEAEMEALKKMRRPSHREDLHKGPLKSDLKLSDAQES